MPAAIIVINRAPVLTLWASVVAERLGFDRQEALSLGRAVAGLTAQAKGRRIGVFQPAVTKDGRPTPKHGLGEEFWVDLCGRAIPAKNTPDGVRAVEKDRPVNPQKVEEYLAQKFGADLLRARQAMARLAATFPPSELSAGAFGLYEKFRPSVPAGERGWGAKGKLDLEILSTLGRS